MDSEDDLSIEAEIQRELDKLTEADLETSESSNIEASSSDNSLSVPSPQVLPEGFDNYLKSLQQQTSAFELDLAECDDLLKQSVEITSSRDVIPLDTELEQVLAEQGENLEELKLKILKDLDATDNDYDSDLDDREDDTSTQENEEEKEDKALVLVTEEQLELRQLLASQKEKVQEQIKKQEEQLAQIIEKEKHEEEVFEKEMENKRQEMIQQMEREESRILTERKEKQQEEERLQKIIEMQMEEEMKKQQMRIQELEETARKEKEEWILQKKEEQLKQEMKKEKSAVKIQSVYRGYRTRKQYKNEVDNKRSEAREKRIQEKVKQIEEEQKKMEEEEERQKKIEEEKKRKEEEKRIQEEKRKEEERKKKEEEERKKQEELDRKQKEKEEKLRKEEEKKKKAEEEKLRKEDEKKKKAEEKKRKEEEKKQREEEEKQKREEEKRKKKEEEERKRNEELERKKKEEEEKLRKIEEEKQKAIEKEKHEKEEQKRNKEEQQRKEMEKLRQEELEKQEEKLKEFLSEESKDVNENKISTKPGTSVNVNHDSKHSPRKSVRQSKDKVARESSIAEKDDLEINASKGLKNGVSCMEGLPSHLESKRLGWIKSCTPWSKVSNEPWKLKTTTSKRPARRPSSAKKLSLLEENIILSAAKVASLRQVTTVELQDLPGSNMSTLGHCTGLQCLKMVNCNLVAIEGLQQCKQLQYLDLKNNKIEYVDLKGLGNIKFIDLSNNMISVIHGMENCTDVRWLDLSHNKITRLGGLNGLRRLHTLNLAKNQLINIQGLGDTPTIQQLDLSHNHLQEVEDINKLCLLQHINLSGNNLLEVPDLQNHVLLQDLLLDDNNITSVDRLVLYWLPLVQKLNISQNSLEDLVSLENLLLLREVDISNNQITDIDVFQSSLQNCAYVEILSFCGNPAIESLEDINSFRNSLSESLLRLCKIDDCAVNCKLHGTPVKPRNSFEAMCLHQVQMIKDVHHRFQGDLKTHSNTANLHELCEIYFKYCDKSNKMAEEFRYAHEYGEVSVTVPTAPTTPKSGRPRSARVNKSQQDSYMSPKEMFEKALQGGGGKNTGTNGMVRSDNIAVVKPVVTAKLVQNIIEDDHASQKKLHRRNEAAIKIQSIWRGYSTRKEINQALQDMAVLEELHVAATKIQALWRGYNLRLKLERALDFAKFEDDEELGEVDLGDFNFNEDILDDWKPPPTPVMPNSHVVLGKPPSGKKLTPPKIPSLHLGETQHPPPPKRAWRGIDSPLSDIQHQPRPPSSLVSAADTHRTAASKKEEKISEEWGFTNNQTAHLMLQRAKKMKYNAERRKKLSKLDPKQRLLLYRKLEETSHYPHVQASRKVLPRKEYFQERQKEIDNAEREKRLEKSEKQSRTFEWLHTQVGDYEVTDSHINNNNQGNKHRQRFGSDGNLPRLDSGKHVRLVSSPVDLQSVDSVSIQGDFNPPRRFSVGSSDSQTRLPPIKGGSAPIDKKRERMSFRNPRKTTDIGWGSGKKRVVH